MIPINFSTANKILLRLKEGTDKTKISKKVGSTYSHVVKTVNHLEESDLVFFEKSGTSRKVFLTPKGKRARELMMELTELLQ